MGKDAKGDVSPRGQMAPLAAQNENVARSQMAPLAIQNQNSVNDSDLEKLSIHATQAHFAEFDPDNIGIIDREQAQVMWMKIFRQPASPSDPFD